MAPAKKAVKKPAKKAAKKAVKKVAAKKAVSKAETDPEFGNDVIDQFEKKLGSFQCEKRTTSSGVSYWREHGGRMVRLITIRPRPRSVYVNTPLSGMKIRGDGISGEVGRKLKYRGKDSSTITAFITEVAQCARDLAKSPPPEPAKKSAKKAAKKAVKKTAAKKAVKKASAKKPVKKAVSE